MKEFNIPQKLIPTAKVEMAYDNLRNNVILYTSLKKYLDKKEKEYAFLQKKYQEYQAKLSQQNPNQMGIPPHPQQARSVQRPDKNFTQIKNPNARLILSDPKEQDLSSNTQNKNVPNINNNHVQNLNIIKVNDTSTMNNVINQQNNEIKNNGNNNNTNINNEQQDSKPAGHKEKRKRIPGTPKARKRKSANEEDAPEEEKEQKSNSKKKKKGTK